MRAVYVSVYLSTQISLFFVFVAFITNVCYHHAFGLWNMVWAVALGGSTTKEFCSITLFLKKRRIF